MLVINRPNEFYSIRFLFSVISNINFTETTLSKFFFDFKFFVVQVCYLVDLALLAAEIKEALRSLLKLGNLNRVL